MQAARVARPIDELVGGPCHCRHDHCHLTAAVDFPLDAPRDVLDPRDIGDRGAAEFLNNARHAPLESVRQACRRDHSVPLLSARSTTTYLFPVYRAIQSIGL